jgi:hypothetical protein
VDEQTPQYEPASQPEPNPFVVPPPSASDAPPTRRSTVTRRVRNAVISVAILVISIAVMGHIGRGGVSASDLDTGMCIRMPEGTFKSAHREDCTKPHDAEIVGRVDDVTTMPVLEGTASDADKACRDRFESYTGTTFDAGTYTLGFFEKKTDINAGTGDVTCFVRANGEQLTRSLAKPAT